MDETEALRQHASLVEALRNPGAYAHPAAAIEVIETHISSVLLAGEFAYKVKKPVNLGFVDFSLLERRKFFCQEELRLNRRGAPSLYMEVVPITGDIRNPHVGNGSGAVIEYAVRMRRFAADARLDQIARAGLLSPAHIDQLASSVAAYHEQCTVAPVGSVFGSPELILRWATDNLGDLERAQLSSSDTRRVRELRAWTLEEFARRASAFTQRRNAGCVRECHGDLHLGNIVLLQGEPVPFDCIEFNDELRFIDVLNDVAFAFMDLIDHGLAPFAWRFLGAYLERVGDYEGLATLRFYAVYRALVRAKIAVIRCAQAGISASEKAADWASIIRYIKVAHMLSQPPAPQLILICGVTGSGKTTVAQVLLEQLGAVRLRSDLERKRLHGVAATSHLAATGAVGEGLYDTAATERTYARLGSLASVALNAGITAIVDATFLKGSQRQSFRDLAARHKVGFSIVECVAPPATLRARVTERLARGDDASDATTRVLARQLEQREALSAQEQLVTVRVDTNTDPHKLQTRCVWLARKVKSGRTRREQVGQSVTC